MTPSTSTVHQPRRDICSGHGREHQRIVAIVAGESLRRYARYCDLTTPMLLPKQIATRPLHPLMWIGVLVILVVIALVNGCGV